MKKLPVDIQAFETMREDDYLYVDKTRYIHGMIDKGRFYFLSRPRRFGKSLLISTLKCLFQGRKELFDGLWIAEHGDWEWKEYPIVFFDFNVTPHDTPENFKRGLERNLKKTARTNGVDLEEPLLQQQFEELILALRHKFGMPVIVLLDEYDKPIIDHLGKGEDAIRIARENRDILKRFLGVLKGGEVAPHLRFVFITGVSKFTRVSIFSELNNLIDITMSEPYANLLGYTGRELEECFKEHIERFADKTGASETEVKEKLRRHYDGYRFSDRTKRVYNPFSIVRALSDAHLKNYWFETGTPAFLVNLLAEKEWDLSRIEGMKVSEQLFSTYDLDNLRPAALLFQTGYVTIKDVKSRLYMLDYPNQEVKTSFLEHLLYHVAKESGGDAEECSKFLLLSEYLHQEEYDLFFETVNAIFASIAYTINAQRDEAYFHTIFYLMVCASGANASSEILTSRGRVDLTVEYSDKVFIMEFKCDHGAAAGIKQIHDKGYAEKYKQSGKKLILM
ncbi:MAG: AAA family ATPase, partial [Desulfobacterales bacterium]|nr:AAA family ATPase [Desulfobacterales bacterium]